MKKTTSKLGFFLFLFFTNFSFAQTITANFTTTATTICQGTTLTFTDVSTATGTVIINWGWTFDGGAPVIGQGPQNYTFNTPGSIDVILGVTDGILNETFTQTIIVNSPANSGTDNTYNFCSNATPAETSIDLNTLLGGGQDLGGSWLETSTVASGTFTSGTGLFDGNGLTIGNVYTFTYTATGTAPCPDAVSTITVTITDCSTLITANFTTTTTTICEGTTLTFTDVSTATGTAITNWGWTFDGEPPIIGQGPQDYTFNTPGSIDVTLGITDGTLNETFTQTIIVNANPTLTITATPSTTVCTGDEVTLTAIGADTYIWDNGITNNIPFTPTTGSTTYTVTGTTNGCTNTSQSTINVADCAPILAGFEFADNICLGSCINFTDTSSGTPVSWLWDFGTSTTPITSTDQNPSTICFNTAGVFTIQLTVTNADGESNSTTNSITVFDSPTITAFHDTLIDLGGVAELNSSTTTFGDVLWTPNTYYINCDTCLTTYAQPQLNTDYIATITDLNGCTAKDTVKVRVNFIEGIGVPQAFSPNADGNNDQLVVKGFALEKMKFTVYNRYGQLVFQTDNQNNGWDGSFNGKPENPGVFVWTLEYTFLNYTTGSQKGNTTLIR